MSLQFLDWLYNVTGTWAEATTMPNIEPFIEGQEVFLKRPIQIYAKVIGAFEGDSGLPGGLLCYAVQLLPLEQIYLPEYLEPSCRPQPAQPQPEEVRSKGAGEFAPAAELEPSLSEGEPFLDLEQEINDLIAGRAYELYKCRGSAHGDDAGDWYQASTEILVDVPVEITESETQFTIRAGVPGFTENDLEVRVVPCSVCITGKKLEGSQREPGSSEWRSNRIFQVLDLPSEIDPSSVEAYVSRGSLEIKLRKVGFRKVVPVRAKAASA
jgi:HSP20 family protein